MTVDEADAYLTMLDHGASMVVDPERRPMLYTAPPCRISAYMESSCPRSGQPDLARLAAGLEALDAVKRAHVVQLDEHVSVGDLAHDECLHSPMLITLECAGRGIVPNHAVGEASWINSYHWNGQLSTADR